MKVLFSLVVLFSLSAASQTGDAITGRWLKANKKDLIIEIFKDKDVYNGKD